VRKLADACTGAGAFSPDGRRIIAWQIGSQPLPASVCDVQTGQRMITLGKESEDAKFVSFFPDGKRIIVAKNGKFTIWDAGSGQLLVDTIKQLGKFISVDVAAMAADGKRIATGDFGQINIRDTDTFQIVRSLSYKWPDFLHSLAFSRDGGRIAAAISRRVEIWDLQ
jgi:WD40 repeat protein